MAPPLIAIVAAIAAWLVVGALGLVRPRDLRIVRALFIAGAVVLYRRADRRSALRLYLYSLAYLAALFAAMVVDAKV